MKGQAANLQLHKLQITKLLSISGALEVAQLKRMLDIREENLETVLTQMKKSGRLIRNQNLVAESEEALSANTPAMRKSMWVFADMIRRAGYYTSGLYPAAVCFFEDGAEYEIIPVEAGQEAIINRAAMTQAPPMRFIVIDDVAQIGQLHIDGVCAYCTVDPDGRVQYYRPTKGASA